MKLIPRLNSIEATTQGLESRVDTGISRKLVQADLNPIGMTVPSFLSLAQFQAINGTGWRLADGGSCVGTAYATITGSSTLPNMCGAWIKGKNHSRATTSGDTAGDRAIGHFQTNLLPDYSGYSYTSYATFRNTNSGALYGEAQYSSGAATAYSSVTYDSSGSQGQVSFDASLSSAIYQSVTEVRIKNICVNWFIKVDD